MAYEPRQDPKPPGRNRIRGERAKTISMAQGPAKDPWSPVRPRTQTKDPRPEGQRKSHGRLPKGGSKAGRPDKGSPAEGLDEGPQPNGRPAR